MLKVYVIATSDNDARERFTAAVRYFAGDDIVNAPDLCMTEFSAGLRLAAQLADVERDVGVDQLDPNYCAFVRSAKVFVVEVVDLLVGEA